VRKVLFFPPTPLGVYKGDKPYRLSSVIFRALNSGELKRGGNSTAYNKFPRVVWDDYNFVVYCGWCMETLGHIISFLRLDWIRFNQCNKIFKSCEQCERNVQAKCYIGGDFGK